MSLWNSTDANTGAPKFAVASGLGISANGNQLYGNTQVGAFKSNLAIGVFGVSASEASNTQFGGANTTHAGWVLRTVGQGGRAGRIFYETLVAGGNVSAEAGGTDNTVIGS